ncbi:MAG: hypothetical protein JW706_04320 [Opitutales bacterium]|nr:hypothetical protein [Opitutales bacterium]
MNTSDSSKLPSRAIRYESELIANFREWLSQDPDLQWAFEPGEHATKETLRLEIDGRHLRFQVHYSLKPSISWLDHINNQEDNALVVAPNLTPRILQHCKQLGIPSLDLNGRVWIRAPGVLIDRQAFPGRSFSYELEPRNIFTGKSERIVRTLLTNVKREWTQAEVTRRTDASAGLVSRIFSHLVSLGYIEKTKAREFRFADHQGLIDDWLKADVLRIRVSLVRYTGLAESPETLAQKIHRWAKTEGVKIAFTQWIAAWWRVRYTEPVIVSAYLESPPDSETLEKLGLRPVNEGGILWLLIPKDPGVLHSTHTIHDYPVVTDAQICLDLQNAGLRASDAVEALRNAPDFCARPS